MDISPAAFKLHHIRLDHFESCLNDFEISSSDVEKLEVEALQKFNLEVKEFIDQQNMTCRSVNCICRITEEIKEWLTKSFKGNKKWATRFRNKFLARKKKGMKTKYKPFVLWLERTLESDECVSNVEAKEKYTTLYGAPKSQTVSPALRCGRDSD